MHTHKLVGTVTCTLVTCTLFASAAHAGVVVGSGSLNLWGQAAPYRTWEITGDVSGGFSQPFDAIPFGMGFHDGRLYIANRGEFRYGPGFTYTPGPGGQLTTATVLRSTGVPSNDPLRFSLSQSFAFNTSGQGFGAGAAFVNLIRPDGLQSAFSAVTMSASGPSFLPGTRTTLAASPRDLDYVASTDRFIGVAYSGGSFVGRVVSYSHTSAGLTELPGGFDLGLYDKAVAVVSGGFASSVLGQSVADAQVLMVAGAPTDAGLLEQLELSFRTLEGATIGTRQVAANIGIPSVRAIAVDEASGQVYVGGADLILPDRGVITAISIPGPGALLTFSIYANALACGRRRGR
jgi:hypothetical protein